jgi:hypothetical protein
MSEVEDRIERLEQLLASPGEAEVDEAVARHTLRLLRQLRAELSFA